MLEDSPQSFQCRTSIASSDSVNWPLLSSRLSFIFVSASAAIGLGNIWKFPYMVGVYGGSAFVLIYFICILLVGLPTMIAEIFIGRAARKDPVNSFKQLCKTPASAKRWQWGGLIALLTSFIAFSFYSVVAGWAIGYAVLSAKQAFLNQSHDAINQLWHHFLASPGELILYHTIFIVMTIFVNALGVLSGIERLAKYALPMLLAVLLVLVAMGAYYGNLIKTLDFMFSFRVFEINPEALISALGHSFFTLAVGAGSMMVYGSYMASNQCIMRSVIAISTMDVIIALLAGLAIFPIVFAYQLTPEAGPGLMFQVLPIAFGQMPMGHFVGFLFFILLLFSAWTTAIAMVEPILSYLMKTFSFSRIQAGFWIGFFAWGLGLASVFSFNIWSDYTLLGKFTIFDLLTTLVSNVMLPLGGLAVALFAGWGIKQAIVKGQINSVPDWLFTIWHLVLRYVTPLGIICIMIYSFF